ncbi:MAG: hypothetical protein HUJ58_08355, partial [Erysipelotrichaceae bacterium]|nr:hypothetical protein [Erysipelotrichaceae bacterium]
LELTDLLVGEYTVEETAYTIEGKAVKVKYTIGNGTKTTGDSATVTVSKDGTVDVAFEDDYTNDSGKIKITKIYKESTKETKTDKVFYAQVFEDKELTVPYTDILPIPMMGKARQTITVEVELGNKGADKTYYVAEVTEDGDIVKSSGKMTVTIDNPSPTVTNEIVPETVITNDYDAIKTADTTSSIGWMITYCVSIAVLFALLFAKKRIRLTKQY